MASRAQKGEGKKEILIMVRSDYKRESPMKGEENRWGKGKGNENRENNRQATKGQP
jgi:hypothetical protein